MTIRSIETIYTERLMGGFYEVLSKTIYKDRVILTLEDFVSKLELPLGGHIPEVGDRVHVHFTVEFDG